MALAEIRPPGDTRVALAFWDAVRHVQPDARAEDLFDAVAAVLGVMPGVFHALVDHARPRARQSIARGRARGLVPVIWRDAVYPSRLKTIPDPPVAFWARGDLSVLSRPTIAVVGSRRATPSGLAVARQLATDLAEAGFCIVSGLARGVDGAAHAGALAAGGVTAAVLGCGADLVYPHEHERLATEILASGVVLSEFSPGTPPLPPHFPLRNRIISGLCRAVLIVEAGEKSGSLITARCALEQGREVLAVPGNVLSGRNRGGHALLKDGAKIVESADDILEELGLPAPGGRRANTPEDPVLSALPAGEPCDLDVLVERTGLTSARLLQRLFELELAGLIRRVGGGRFTRV